MQARALRRVERWARGRTSASWLLVLEDVDADHKDAPYQTNVRWLSLEKVVERVCELRKEVVLFLEIKERKNVFLEFCYLERRTGLAFLVAIMDFLNRLWIGCSEARKCSKKLNDLPVNFRGFSGKLECWLKMLLNPFTMDVTTGAGLQCNTALKDFFKSRKLFSTVLNH